MFYFSLGYFRKLWPLATTNQEQPLAARNLYLRPVVELFHDWFREQQVLTFNWVLI